MTKRLIGQATIQDSFGNRDTLLIYRGNGEISYNLHGETSYIPFSLGNLGLKESLPCADTGLEESVILKSVTARINAGPQTVVEMIEASD